MYEVPQMFQIYQCMLFVTFIDDCTWVTWAYLLKQKSEVNSCFFNFSLQLKINLVSIKRIRSENAKDYFNHGFNSSYQKEGIIHKSSCVKTL
jgi:hypothetical protein